MSSNLKSFIWAACKELQQVDSAEACAHVLRRTAQVLRLSVEDLCELGTPGLAAAEALQRLEAFERLLDQGRGAFWKDQQVLEQAFSYLAEVLLSGAGCSSPHRSQNHADRHQMSCLHSHRMNAI